MGRLGGSLSGSASESVHGLVFLPGSKLTTALPMGTQWTPLYLANILFSGCLPSVTVNQPELGGSGYHP